MTDATITVPDQASGSKVDVSQVTRTVDGEDVIANRQRVTVSDGENPDGHARVYGEQGKGRLATTDLPMFELMTQIANDMREIKLLLKSIKL